MMNIGHNWLRMAKECAHHTVTAAAALMAIALVSCSADELLPCDNENQEVTVTFTMSLGEPTQGTRAENEGWDDYNPTDPNTDAENAVDVNDLYIVVCDNDGKKVGEVSNIIATPVENTSNTDSKLAKQYTVYGSWEPTDDTVLASAKKVMVFANCSQNDTKPNFTNLSATSLFFDRKTDTPLPMWGVVSLSNGLSKGKKTDLGDIWLLRATAKVDVALDTENHDMSDYQLKSVTLHNYNTKGYVLPATWNTVDNTQKIRFSGSLNAYASAPSDDNGLSFKLSDDKNKTNVLYIPEYDNTASETDATDFKHSYITLVLADKNDNEVGTYDLNFCDYSDDGAPTENSYYDIQRNHYYQFLVYKESNKLKIKVRKWLEKTNSLIQM